jgi:hypothetical protein
MKRTRILTALAAAGALAAVPVGADANNGSAHAQNGSNHGCDHHPTVTRSFVLTGRLVSYDGNTVEITVKNANRHARHSGEITDQDANKAGVQVKGASYSVSDTSDSFVVKESGYETGENPAAGDKVRIRGRISYTRKHCAPELSTADRYGAPNIRRVRFIDVD